MPPDLLYAAQRAKGFMPHPEGLVLFETAAQYGIASGERVIIRSPVGHLEVEVLVDARIGRGMVIMPVGTWIKRGGGANVLTEDIMSNFGQMAAYGETRVRLERLVAA